MKIFKIESVNVAFDEDEFMIICASNVENALKLAKNNWNFRDGKNPDLIQFNVKEIDTTNEQIIAVAHFGD